jgi:hypothetical protein
MSDKKTPAFVFIDNPTERLLSLRRVCGDAPKGQPAPQEKTAVGRGLNFVRADYISASTPLGFGMTVIDPTKILEHDVARQIHRCTSRQALAEWGKIEKRAGVLAQIKARLNRNTPAAEADAEA